MLAEEGTRRDEILRKARRLLEAGGPEALTMRGLGEAVGMRAPSLYKHFPHKGAVEDALVGVGLRELGGALDAALAAFAEPVAAFAAAYRAWAVAHPHLYRLVMARRVERVWPVQREISTAHRLLTAAGGDAALARALWGLCHGLALLEIGGRFPRGAAAEAAWASGVAALARASAGPEPSTDAQEERESAEPRRGTGGQMPPAEPGLLGRLDELRRRRGSDGAQHEPGGEDATWTGSAT